MMIDTTPMSYTRTSTRADRPPKHVTSDGDSMANGL